ncbi:CAP domain-containing protein [Paraclostridium bifermentans]|uniref:CAP domain-containing protein n=1 Tax=Paraclostridium bifermentans TaxID=1490 RepID=UPI001FF392FE|nr:CAP domain-containing protein [Paraclostridium bifermentans]UOW67053.1 CAP domain-containing protein [Paraclostridium bifermentans]
MNIKVKTLLSLGVVSIIGVCSTLPINAASNETVCKKVLCDNKSYEEYLSVNVNGKDCATPIKPLHYLIQDILNNKGKCPTSQSKPSTPNVDNNTESKPDSKPEGNTGSNASKPSTPNVDNNTGSKPDSKPEGNTGSNQESKPEVKPEQPSNPSGNFASFQKEVLDLVNKERTSRGLQALKFNSELSNVATLKSQDMIDKNYFDHTSPTYGSPFDMMKKFGISYTSAGENIAMGQETPQEVMNAWMNSDGHRKNILNPDFTELGVGIAAKGSSLYWTQMFIGK